MAESWVNPLERQCRTSGVAFFFKQWGGVRKSETGRLLDGCTYDDLPKLTQITGYSIGEHDGIRVSGSRTN